MTFLCEVRAKGEKHSNWAGRLLDEAGYGCRVLFKLRAVNLYLDAVWSVWQVLTSKNLILVALLAEFLTTAMKYVRKWDNLGRGKSGESKANWVSQVAYISRSVGLLKEARTRG